ncbi:RagB/SusD family nutrient uptake outer membrane protein [Hoylesella buccalis]|uniref:RagB/SusD family nutrient uptake outer membrane protein n=1 Tax=Hoylesella buccalis TaxID=28127 RepID=UPI001D15095E|nr:RagB/SusD family nutrient uptake outer membrane protein [Hoylesella buccalis]UEA63524.1 RagB/SusD family nutrient uptake outer membrane protein [Hoylesella buccalis]UWP49185.1 RagB/SusD family nutrient uptake outer membrane protein [Hoylesella buccalis ATCC 35310]
MKKYIFGTLLLSTALLSGCSLDETPKSAFSEEEAFKSSTLIYANSVANVYSSIQNYIYGQDAGSIHTLQQYSSDESMIPGRQGDWVDGGKWQNFFLHNFDSSVDMYRNIWNQIYTIIGQSNKGIDKLNGLQNNEDAATYVYELRALRAIFYYYLMDLWGQVPLVTSSKINTNDVVQSNRADVFKFVVSELEACLPHLADDMSQNEGKYYGRITKPVVYMCLVKCAMNSPLYTINPTSATSYQAFVGNDMSGNNTVSETLGANVTELGKKVSITVDGKARNAWETVKYCVEKLEALGYTLQPNYADNFTISNQNSKENIFTRPNDDKTYRYYDYNLMRSLHYNHAGAIGYSGWNGACATVFAMNVYGYGTADVDPRLKLNYYTDKDYMEDTGKAVEDGATGQDLEYLPLKPQVDFPADANAHDVKCAGARMKKYQLDLTSSTNGITNNDLVVWRYADALLLKAEAEYRLGNTGAALAAINTVRARVGAPALTSLTLNVISNERLKELAWEGVRRMDAIRYGIFTQPTKDRYEGVWHNAVAGNYLNDTQGYTTIFPIPYDVMSLNKNLKQNPGY